MFPNQDVLTIAIAFEFTHSPFLDVDNCVDNRNRSTYCMSMTPHNILCVCVCVCILFFWGGGEGGIILPNSPLFRAKHGLNDQGFLGGENGNDHSWNLLIHRSTTSIISALNNVVHMHPNLDRFSIHQEVLQIILMRIPHAFADDTSPTTP